MFARKIDWTRVAILWQKVVGHHLDLDESTLQLNDIFGFKSIATSNFYSEGTFTRQPPLNRLAVQWEPVTSTPTIRIHAVDKHLDACWNAVSEVKNIEVYKPRITWPFHSRLWKSCWMCCHASQFSFAINTHERCVFRCKSNPHSCNIVCLCKYACRVQYTL